MTVGAKDVLSVSEDWKFLEKYFAVIHLCFIDFWNIGR